MLAIDFDKFQLSRSEPLGVCNAIASLCRNLVRLRRVRRSVSARAKNTVVLVWAGDDFEDGVMVAYTLG